MYRRLSIRLLCLALFTFFTLPAFAQYTRDNAASKKIDELQSVIAYLKENGPEYPLQFVNFT